MPLISKFIALKNYIPLGQPSLSDFTINTEEIADYKYINHEDLTQDMKFSPEQYTPWFKMEWERLLADFRSRLEIYF